MTEARLAEIEALAVAAQPGPWSMWVGAGAPTIRNVDNGGVCRMCPGIDTEEADGAFIAAARTDVPDLLAEIERLRAENAALRAQFDRDTAAMDAETDRSSREAQDLRDALEVRTDGRD